MFLFCEMETKTLDLAHVATDYTNIFNEEEQSLVKKKLRTANIENYLKFLEFLSYLNFYAKEL